jgi:phage shock protein E
MKNIVIKYKLELIGVALGSIAGWGYWYFVGCASGTCAITSSPVNSSLYGAMMGGILASMFRKDKKEEKSKQ